MCFLFVKIFCCYVYFVSKETVRRQQNDKEWKLKEQRAKTWENIAAAKMKDTVAPVVSTLRGGGGASAPVAPAVPTPLALSQ